MVLSTVSEEKISCRLYTSVVCISLFKLILLLHCNYSTLCPTHTQNITLTPTNSHKNLRLCRCFDLTFFIVSISSFLTRDIILLFMPRIKVKHLIQLIFILPTLFKHTCSILIFSEYG